MTTSRAAVRESDQPTPAQLKEFFSQIDSGRITRAKLQDFLALRNDEGAAEDSPYYRNLTGCMLRMLDDSRELRLAMCPEDGVPAEVYPGTPLGWHVEFANGFRAPALIHQRTVTNLPAPKKGTFLIVTRDVAETCIANGQPVDDLLVPDSILSEDDEAIVFRQFRAF